MHSFCSDGSTPIIAAAQYGGLKNIEALHMLIDARADITARSAQIRGTGETDLGAAVRRKKTDVISFLKSLGAPM